ncbi:MAG: DUF58 domain-containing protein [Nitrospirae bacterium]|nr:DUF58 domain-containing protein [Nitrospirota bacterium]
MKIRATREGKRFVLAVLVVGFAALNTGNNLMYLIFSMLFSVLVISLALPYLNLRGIKVDIEVEEPVYANTETFIGITISNTKQLLPSYSIRFLIPGLMDEGVYIEQVGPHSTMRFERKIRFKKRGYLTIRDFKLLTSFPFIFFEFQSVPEGKMGILVYPELMAVEEGFLEPSSLETESGTISRANGEDVHGLREYRPGDSIREIHWKATAKRGELMVKEVYEAVPKNITLVLDNTPAQEEALFEKAVSLAASLCTEFIKMGYSLRFITCAKTIPFGSGMEHLFKILDLLAVIKRVDRLDCPLKELERGTLYLILASPTSPFNRYASRAKRVFYAERL